MRLFRGNKGSVKDAGANRRVVTFFFCLLISVFVWLLMSLSKEYVISVSFPVKYVNLPKDKLIANQLPEVIDLELRSTGFNLLVYKLKQHRETVMFDINDVKASNKKNNYYILSNSRLDRITSQFSEAIKVVHIKPDTVFVNYNKKISKTVPVHAIVNIEFADQYQQADSIQLEPKTIEVMGSKEALAKIEYVETAVYKLKNQSTNAIIDMRLEKKPDMKQIEFSQNTVKARINVMKFTEAQVELPIEVLNLPVGLNLKTFPDKVTLKYQVAFDDYGKINTSDFKVVVDYSKIEKGSNKLKLSVQKSPLNVRAIKLSAEKVEYIIRK